MHRVPFIDRPRNLGKAGFWRHRPFDADIARPWRTHALEVAVNAFGHVFIRRNQFTCPAAGLGELPHEMLGHGSAHANRKDTVPGFSCIAQNRLLIPDLAVGDQQHVLRNIRFTGEAVRRLERRTNLSATPVRVQPSHEAARLFDVFVIYRYLTTEQCYMITPEGHDIEIILRAQRVQDAQQGLAGLCDGVSPHGPGAVDDNLQASRRLVLRYSQTLV